MDGREINTIYIAILDEGTDCWRPVQAVRVREGIFRIIEQAIPEDENWEFRPGDTVGCDLHDFADGTALRAFKKAEM
jgi:hypothetical protein